MASVKYLNILNYIKLMYSSFTEAHRELKISGDPDAIINFSDDRTITCLKINNNKRTNGGSNKKGNLESYNEILQNGRIIKFVGVGKSLRSGHPNSNQQWSSQEPFRFSWEKNLAIPLLLKGEDGIVKSMGTYQITDIIKRESFEGFTFFQIILKRSSPHHHHKKLYLKTLNPYRDPGLATAAAKPNA